MINKNSTNNMKGKIFTAQEVQSILNESKVMFREVIKRRPWDGLLEAEFKKGYIISELKNEKMFIKCPYGRAGEKIFVKESFADFRNNNSDIFYKSDFEVNNLVKIADLKWKPAQHMKQEHSRLTLLIKEIKVERLADISEEDCWKEGLDLDNNHSKLCFNIEEQPYSNDLIDGSAIKTIFARDWNKTHKKPEEKFDANPWVWVLKFELVKNNL